MLTLLAYSKPAVTLKFFTLCRTKYGEFSRRNPWSLTDRYSQKEWNILICFSESVVFWAFFFHPPPRFCATNVRITLHKNVSLQHFPGRKLHLHVWITPVHTCPPLHGRVLGASGGITWLERSMHPHHWVLQSCVVARRLPLKFLLRIFRNDNLRPYIHAQKWTQITFFSPLFRYAVLRQYIFLLWNVLSWLDLLYVHVHLQN